MPEQVRFWSDGRAVRSTIAGDVPTRRRKDETQEQLEARVRGGFIAELVPDWITGMRATRAKGTVRQYRTDYNSLIKPTLGSTWLTDCNAAAYRAFLEAVIDEKGHSRFLAARRTLGALTTWAVTEHRWPAGYAPFGGSEFRKAAGRELARHAAVTATATERSLITIDDCPTWDETCAFADTLADAAARRWGDHARALGQLPKVQYLTGTRIAETFVLRTRDFDLRRGTCHVARQGDRNSRWPLLHDHSPEAHEAFDPPVTLTKNKRRRGHTASLWEWALPELEALLADAEKGRGGWLFATLLPYKWPLRELGDFIGEVRHKVGYKWTPHAHRHAYISWNLMPTSENGYGKAPGTVATWVGDLPSTVSSTYWHPSVDPEQGWSRHRPGQRQHTR